MTPSRTSPRDAALASLHAAFGSEPAPTTRPISIASGQPGSRRLILSLQRV